MQQDTQLRPKLITVNRDQLLLRPTNIDDLVAADHKVRAIWELTGRLDLSAYYQEIDTRENEAGRPAWDPRLMICLWILAYSEGVGSAREIEKPCEYHPAFQWLTGMEIPNHHSLSDFRVRNDRALKRLFSDVLGLMSAEGLVTLRTVTRDGSKVGANAGVDSFSGAHRLQRHIAAAKEQIEAMGDPRSATEVCEQERERRQRAAEQKLARLGKALEELKKRLIRV